jgi:hypothetical protein
MKITAIQLKSINSIDTIFDFLKVSIQHRLTVELLQQEAHPPLLTLEFNQSHLAVFFKENQFSHIEIIALLLALIPHISPNFLNEIITEFLPNGGEFPEFGGVKGKNHRGILPTGKTLLYIINGTCLDERLRTLEYLYSQSKLFKEKILYIESVPKGDKNPQNAIWEVDNYDIAVPENEWFLTEFYWKWSNNPDGRTFWKINHNIIADYNGATTRNFKPIDFIILNQIYGDANPKHQWIDDIAIWDGIPE